MENGFAGSMHTIQIRYRQTAPQPLFRITKPRLCSHGVASNGDEGEVWLVEQSRSIRVCSIKELKGRYSISSR